MPRHLEPAWDAPLDGETYLREVPATASIKGMFPAAIAVEAKSRGIELVHASERYRAFLDYPLSKHMALLLEAAGALWPEVSTRRALRKMGRAAIGAFTQSTIGKTVLAGLLTKDTVPHALNALIRAYAIAISRPSPVMEVRDDGDSTCIVRLTDFWVFLDSHQVGILEGLCRACGVKAEITLWTEGLSRGEFVVRWRPDDHGPSRAPGAPT